MTFENAKQNVLEVLEPWATAEPNQVVNINGKNCTRSQFLDEIRSNADNGFFVRQFCKENLGIELD